MTVIIKKGNITVFDVVSQLGVKDITKQHLSALGLLIKERAKEVGLVPAKAAVHENGTAMLVNTYPPSFRREMQNVVSSYYISFYDNEIDKLNG